MIVHRTRVPVGKRRFRNRLVEEEKKKQHGRIKKPSERLVDIQ